MTKVSFNIEISIKTGKSGAGLLRHVLSNDY